MFRIFLYDLQIVSYICSLLLRLNQWFTRLKPMVQIKDVYILLRVNFKLYQKMVDGQAALRWLICYDIVRWFSSSSFVPLYLVSNTYPWVITKKNTYPWVAIRINFIIRRLIWYWVCVSDDWVCIFPIMYVLILIGLSLCIILFIYFIY